MTDHRMMPWSQPGDVEEDGDEVFTPMPTHCTRFECNFEVDYRGNGPTKKRDPSPLFRNALGFMECSRCHSSYGRG